MIDIRLRENFNLPFFEKATSADLSFDEITQTLNIESYKIEKTPGVFISKNTSFTFYSAMQANVDYWISFDSILDYGTSAGTRIKINGVTYSYDDIVNNGRIKTSSTTGSLVIDVSRSTPTDPFSVIFNAITLVQTTFGSFQPVNATDIQLNKAIKNFSDFDKFKVGYSTSFNIYLNEAAKRFFKFIEYGNVINAFFDGEIIEDGRKLFIGTVQLIKITENGNDKFLEIRFVEDVDNFFEGLKYKTLKDLDDSTNLDYSIDSLTNLNAFGHKNNDSKYVLVHDSKSTTNYNPLESRYLYDSIIDNNEVGMNITRDYDSIFFTGDGYFIGEYQPKVFNRYIWDKIHTDAGISYSGDVFTTLDWNSLLVSNNKDLNYTSDELSERKIKAKYGEDGYILYASYDYYDDKYEVVFGTNGNSSINFKVDTSGGEFEGVDVNSEGLNPKYGAYRKLKIKYKIKYKTDSSIDDDVDNANMKRYAQGGFKARVHLEWVKKNTQQHSANVVYFNNESVIYINTNPDPFESKWVDYTLDSEQAFEAEAFGYVPRDNADEYEMALFIEMRTDADFTNEYGIPPAELNNIILGYFSISDVELKMEAIETYTPSDILATRVVNDLLPNIKQNEYLRNIMNLFNLKYKIIDGVVHYYTTEEFYTDGNLINLTNNLDRVSVDIKLSQDFQAKTVAFNYESDEGSIIFENQTNNNESNIVKNKFNIRDTYGVASTDANYLYQEKYMEKNKVSIFNVLDPKDDITYLSYLNTIQNTRSTIVYDYKMNIHPHNPPYNSYVTNTFVTSSSVNKFSTDDDLFTLYNYNKDFNGLGESESNLLTRYGVITKDLLLNPNQRKIVGDFKLTTEEFNTIKINDIIQVDEEVYLIEDINNFNKNKLTKMNLRKFNYNINYAYNIDDIVFNTPWICTGPNVVSINDSVLDTTYTSDEYEIDLQWNGLDNTTDIFFENTGATAITEFSFDDGATWSAITVSETFNIGTDTGNDTFLIRAVTTTDVDEVYTIKQGAYQTTLPIKFNISFVTLIVPIDIVPINIVTPSPTVITQAIGSKIFK